MASPVELNVPIPLRAVVENPALAIEVVADSLPTGALDRPVRWAHVSELRAPAPYLLGDELLLTAGVNLPERDTEVAEYVRGLVAAGVSALGFGVTPPMHEALPESLRRACVREGMPLLVVPTGTPFLAVSRAVTVAVTEAAGRDQRRVADAREALTDGAAGGLGEVARGLAERLSGWVALVGADDRISTGHAVPARLPAELDGILQRLRSGTGIRSATTELADGTVVLAQPVYPQATASHVLVTGRRDRFDGADRSIVAVGAALLGLLGRSGERDERVAAVATAALLDGAPADDHDVAVLLGTGTCRLLGAVRAEHRRDADPGTGWLRARLGTPLVRLDGGECTAILRERPEPEVLDALRERGWLAAVSAPVPVPEIAGGARELPGLRRRAQALGRPVGADAADLGLGHVVDAGSAAAFADRILAPLRRIDDHGGELVATLHTWLACHGGWDRTATALGVHRNSVRHRIARVRRALDADLDDPEVRMELWFALRWSVDPGPSQEAVAR